MCQYDSCHVDPLDPPWRFRLVCVRQSAIRRVEIEFSGALLSLCVTVVKCLYAGLTIAEAEEVPEITAKHLVRLKRLSPFHVWGRL